LDASSDLEPALNGAQLTIAIECLVSCHITQATRQYCETIELHFGSISEKFGNVRQENEYYEDSQAGAKYDHICGDCGLPKGEKHCSSSTRDDEDAVQFIYPQQWDAEEDGSDQAQLAEHTV
jgi:hypothetical protein